jgi:DUF971 family protein
MRPLDLSLAKGGGALEILWEDGASTALTARLLRASCRSAPATRERIEGRQPEPAADITITGLASVGRYAVNLAFSDGHARGIYPWAYLRELAGLSADA